MQGALDLRAHRMCAPCYDGDTRVRFRICAVHYRLHNRARSCQCRAVWLASEGANAGMVSCSRPFVCTVYMARIALCSWHVHVASVHEFLFSPHSTTTNNLNRTAAHIIWAARTPAPPRCTLYRSTCTSARLTRTRTRRSNVTALDRLYWTRASSQLRAHTRWGSPPPPRP